MTAMAEPLAYDLWPRSYEERFRIVKVVDGQPVTICSTPTAEGIGVAIVTLAEDGELEGERIGVFDSLPPEGGSYWLICPFVGERRTL